MGLLKKNKGKLPRKEELKRLIKRNEEAKTKLGTFKVNEELERIYKEKENIEAHIKGLKWMRDILGEYVEPSLTKAQRRLDEATKYMEEKLRFETKLEEINEELRSATKELQDLTELEKLIPYLTHAYQNLGGDSARYLEEAKLSDEGFIVSPHRDRLKEEQCGGFFRWGKDVSEVVLNRTKAMREQAKKGNFESVKGMYTKPLTLGFLGGQRCEACRREVLGIKLNEEEGGLIFNEKLFVEFMKFLLES